MEAYAEWVANNPLFSAMVQFAALGTLGELLPYFVRAKRITVPWSAMMLLGKIAAWGILGIIVKYGFVGMRGFVSSLVEHDLLPLACDDGFFRALALSVFTNIFFGPQMMFFHRLEDNLLARKVDFSGLTRAWWTLIWFWIPAHTITFSLPKNYQIGLAAAWSLALGIILSAVRPKPAAEAVETETTKAGD